VSPEAYRGVSAFNGGAGSVRLAAGMGGMRMNTLIFANNANIYAQEICIQKGMRGIRLWIISRRGSPSVMHRRRGRESYGEIVRDPSGRRMITLFAGADESTFLHELGHLFLMGLDALVAFDAMSAHDRDMVDAWAQWHEGNRLYSVEALEIKEASRKWNAAYNAQEGVLTSFPREGFGYSIPEISSERKVFEKIGRYVAKFCRKTVLCHCRSL
jgi:putative moaD